MSDTFSEFTNFISNDPLMLVLCIAIVVLIIVFILVLFLGKKPKKEEQNLDNTQALLKSDIENKELKSTQEFAAITEEAEQALANTKKIPVIGELSQAEEEKEAPININEALELKEKREREQNEPTIKIPPVGAPEVNIPPAEPAIVSPIPEAPVVPEAPVIPEAPIAPVIPEVPVAPEPPVIPEAPVVPEVPLAPEPPAEPVAPAPDSLESKLDDTTMNIFDVPTPPVPEAPVVPEVPLAPEPPAAPAEPAPAVPEENPFGNLVEQNPPIDGLNQPFSAIGVEGKEMPETPVSSNTEIIKHIPKEEVPATPADEDIELPMLNTNDAQNTLNNLSGETFEIK